MDFESPDVEKEFPGLYASESARKSNESDFSDDAGHEKHSRKELLGGKRKDKKDKKDRGYATLEGESSQEEEETKSPSKSKKTKAFIFPTKKEKREKSREKDGKEKDSDKEKKKKEKDDKDEKEKRKEKDKYKSKLKDKKKNKHGDEGFDISEEMPIFGVSLYLAVERSCCHDGVKLPLVVRECIDYVEECGMTVEGIYKVPAVKSKVQHLKKMYNQRQSVNLSEYEPTVAASLLILFLRELPEPILENSETISRFEQASSTKEVSQREAQLLDLTLLLPECNRTLLAWVTLHLDHVTTCEKITKINAQTIAMTLSPVLQMSHRLLLALLLHCKALFTNVRLTKYIPPLSSGSSLPETYDEIEIELAKQESLLAQIHMLMNAGFVTKSSEEQLWEVQRMITQLKRKYKRKYAQKSESLTQKSVDEEVTKYAEESHVEIKNAQTKQLKDEELTNSKNTSEQISKKVSQLKTLTDDLKDAALHSKTNTSTVEKDTVDTAVQSTISDELEPEGTISVEKEENAYLDKLRENLIYEELLTLQSALRTQILRERNEIERLKGKLIECNYVEKKERPHTPNDMEKATMIQLISENQLLEKKMTTLIKCIFEEKEACVDLRVQLALHHMMPPKNEDNEKRMLLSLYNL